MIRRFGSAFWEGDLKGGKGRLSSESGALDAVPYGFNTRFEDEKGTNPEELIGAAHAACFSMALSNILAGRDGITPGSVETTSTISLDMKDGPKVVKAHLEVTITAQGDRDAIMECAREAETGCPISKLLNCEITMDAKIA